MAPPLPSPTSTLPSETTHNHSKGGGRTESGKNALEDDGVGREALRNLHQSLRPLRGARGGLWGLWGEGVLLSLGGWWSWLWLSLLFVVVVVVGWLVVVAVAAAVGGGGTAARIGAFVYKHTQSRRNENFGYQ